MSPPPLNPVVADEAWLCARGGVRAWGWACSFSEGQAWAICLQEAQGPVGRRCHVAIRRVGRVEEEVLRVHPGSFGRTTTGAVTTFVGV